MEDSKLVVFSPRFFVTQYTKATTTALILYRLLAGGSPFNYIGLSMKVKTAPADSDTENDDQTTTAGVLTLKISNKIPEGILEGVKFNESVSKQRSLVKRAAAYQQCIVKTLKVILFISYMVKSPEKRFLDMPLLRSLRVIYDRLSSDHTLTTDLAYVCRRFIPADMRVQVIERIFKILMEDPKNKNVSILGYMTAEGAGRDIVFIDSLFSKIKNLCEDVLPALREFGVVTSSQTKFNEIDPTTLKFIMVYFDQTDKRWFAEDWQRVYDQEDIFDPYFLGNPFVRENEFLSQRFEEEEASSQNAASQPIYFSSDLPSSSGSYALPLMDDD